MSLVKLAISNAAQLNQFNLMKNNPNMGPAVAGKYDLVTNLANQAKNDPSKLKALRAATSSLKASGVQKVNPLLNKVVTPVAKNVANLAVGGKPGFLSKMVRPLAKVI